MPSTFPIDPRIAGESWRLRRWLLPFCLVVFIGLSLACTFGSAPPATLSVQQPTITPTPNILSTPTPTLPAGGTVGGMLSRLLDQDTRALLDQVESDRLMVSIGTLVDMHTRHVLSRPAKNVGGIAGARDWLVAQFNAMHSANPQQSINVWTQPVKFPWNSFTVSAQNVIAIFEGTDIGAGVIVIGAHYDSMAADPMNGQTYAPGANENASGVAAMLEIAQILASRTHRATIIFVAFAAEETGRQGSLEFVKSYLKAQETPIDLRAMINLDMLGEDPAAADAVDQQSVRLYSAEPNDSPSRQLARQVALIMKSYLDDITPVLESAEERIGYWGDHQSFREAGYPAIRIIQGMDDVGRPHSIHDTPDNIRPDYLMKITRAALLTVTVLADGPVAPTDLALRATPNRTDSKTLVWTPSPGAAEYLVALRKSPSLFYDQIFTVKASSTPQYTWTGFAQYAAVAIAAVDSAGHMGPLCPETSIDSIWRP